MKILKYSLVFTLLVVTLFTCSKDDKGTDSQTYVRRAVPVKVEVAKPQTFVSTLAYNGSLTAIQTARIIPEIPGRIEDLKVEIGDYVSPGQTLVQMDVSTLQLQKKQAGAGVAVARANLLDAEKNWERVATLRTENAVSQQQFEKMKLGLDAAQAQLNQASAGYDLIKMQVDKATLKAPFAGVITQKGFQAGDLFSPAAMMPVYTLQNVSRIKVELQITSNEITKIKKGQRASLKVDYLREAVEGIVTQVGVAADPMSKTFFVECQFDNSNGLLRAGTFGNVEIAIEVIKDVIVIPRRSLIDKSHIFVVQGDYAYERSIEIAQESLSELVVKNGLLENELYVISGAYVLTDSSLVEISE
ncbi:MAG: efflux RND transporter periplasmic adaptor subunit [Candidatus Marinimicrobia bacterium]|nr:efflux RND transporter periplasmic adaptor subunit [Candidatus Neomarinimicrobiota bacterium]